MAPSGRCWSSDVPGVALALTLFLMTTTLLIAIALILGVTMMPAQAADTPFGPDNPFYAPSTLPFQAPPFNKIKDTDYQPAIEAGMAQQLKEMQAIANDPAAPTFQNTFIPMEKSGQLLDRAVSAFFAVTGANTNPTLQKTRAAIAPKLAAHQDAILLDAKLFARVSAIYKQRNSLKLDPESLRLVEYEYDRFVHAGANLSEPQKAELKKMNEQLATLSNDYSTKILEATKAGALITTDKTALTGLSDAQIAAAAEAAKSRKVEGYLTPLQNTTQQPDLLSLTSRPTRQTLFEHSWNRAEHNDANDTRVLIAQIAHLRAQKAKLLGYPNFAAWKLEDQMAKTPNAVLAFLNQLSGPSTTKAASEAKDIQEVIDAQKGGFQVQPWDWDFYAEQVRKAKYDLDQSQVKPYFELDNVLQNGVFYAANQLYGITFKERHDIPVYTSGVRVFEVFNADGSSLALFYCDYFKRDNKNGGAWMNSFVTQSKLMGTKPVVSNVANFAPPAPGEPALLTSDDVRTMFHEFGHALHGMFADTEYPTLSGTSTARDFVEFPSQFNEHWAIYPSVFQHYAKHYKTGEPMPADLVAKIQKSETFNKGYDMTELVAAAQLDMSWHDLPASAPPQPADAFEQDALQKIHLWISYVPPRYRSSYFSHIWSSGSGGYSAGYYAYLWTQMLDSDAYEWFVEHGGLTRANGDRFRRMVLSRGNTENLGKMYETWRGHQPTIGPMLKYRGLAPSDTTAK
jgi:peptidyl-dipeptidase Dcp